METEEMQDLQREIGLKNEQVEQLSDAFSRMMGERDEKEKEVKRLKRVIELKDEGTEALTEHLRLVRLDRDKMREQIGNLLSVIDQWKISSGLY